MSVKDKKKELLKKKKKIHNIMHAEELHEENRQKIKESQEHPDKHKCGGFATPVDETVKLPDWKRKTTSMRASIQSRRAKAKAMWKGR